MFNANFIHTLETGQVNNVEQSHSGITPWCHRDKATGLRLNSQRVACHRCECCKANLEQYSVPSVGQAAFMWGLIWTLTWIIAITALSDGHSNNNTMPDMPDACLISLHEISSQMRIKRYMTCYTTSNIRHTHTCYAAVVHVQIVCVPKLWARARWGMPIFWFYKSSQLAHTGACLISNALTSSPS